MAEHPKDIRRVEQAGEDAFDGEPAVSRAGTGRRDERHEAGDTENRDESGKQPPGAPCIERAERDPAGGRALLEEQRGDEEARENEEEIDAVEASGQPDEVVRSTSKMAVPRIPSSPGTYPIRADTNGPTSVAADQRIPPFWGGRGC
jgi:hypothetical protein